MTNVVPLRILMTPEKALMAIRRAVRENEKLGWSTHALGKLGEEIVMRQALTVLAEGPMKKGPTWSE